MGQKAQSTKGGPAAARAEGRKGSCWRAEEGVAFLPRQEFKRVLRTLMKSWGLEARLEEESGIRVELVAFDDDDDANLEGKAAILDALAYRARLYGKRRKERVAGEDTVEDPHLYVIWKQPFDALFVLGGGD